MSSVVVRRYLDKQTAHLGRSLLEAHGIAARVAGDDEGSMAPHLSYVTGVRLLVAAGDLEAAKRILEKEEGDAAEGERTIGDAWRTAGPERESTVNIRLVPNPADEGDGPEEASLLRGGAGDPALIAYRAATLGTFLVPVVIHVYSLWHVARALKAWSALSARSRRMALIALAIDATVIGVALAMLVRWRALGAA